jgi:hypothetical protein
MNGDQASIPAATDGHRVQHINRLECVFVVSWFYRAVPATMILRQHLLGRRLSAVDDAIQRLQMTRLVAPGVIDAAAPAQARMRKRQAFLCDFKQIAILDAGLEPEPRYVVAQ